MDYGKPAGQAAVAATAVVDAAHANEYFELFVNASSMKHILGYYRGLIDCLHIRPNVFNAFYPKLKANLTSWRAKALLKKFDTRASHKCYMKGKAASNTRVLVIGGGPCGMRTAIEAQLLGAKVVVVEKRDRYSRNNVLHLWPFVIEDLRMLGAKKFFGKFCAGAIDHISIRQLQCILLKCALLLGVEVHTEVGFASLIEPEADTKIGWRAEFKPSNHPVSQYEFDVIIGADGKRNTLQGFSRKEFRGKLAIAITANFINKKTEAEASVEEISGVAFIFNQKFFKDLQEATRIDLENIVYYKDDTHYFVMTAKKHSLIEKGVIKQDFSDTERLLAPENVDKEALQNYAIEAANFSTNYQMPNLEFAVNHYGQPDVAMFDFTSMYAAENASKVLERNGYRLLNILVGDSLLEPFWPTGSGCARGFLSSLDAAWAIRSWSMGTASPLETLAERESIYRLLAQTTPDNLNKDWKSYTLDPATRYPNLNKAVVLPHQVACLYDTDNPANVERMKRNYNEKPGDVPKKRRRGNVDNEILLNWLKDQLKDKEDVVVTDMASVFKDGKVLCAIIHHYRPDLLDYSAISQNDPARNNQIAVDILEKELCIPPVMTGTELSVTEDYLTMATYLTEIYHSFRGEIPFIKHPKLQFRSPKPINFIETIQYPGLRESASPCKKCHKAYHSKLVFYSSAMEKKLLAFNRTCESVIVPSRKNSSQSKRNNVEIVYENSACADRRSIQKRLGKMDCKRSSKVKLNEEYDKRSDPLKKSETCLTQEELQRRCIERIYSKHDKLKRFLTRLLLKKKNSNTTSRTQINQKIESFREISSQTVHFTENSCTQVDKVKTSSAQTEIEFGKKQIERLQQGEKDKSKQNGDNPSANSAEKLIKIHFLNKRLNELSLQTIHYASSEDLLTISSKFAFKRRSRKPRNRRLSTSPRKTPANLKRSRSQKSKSNFKRQREAEESEPTTPAARKMFEGDQIYSRVSNWICSNDFDCLDSGKTETFSMVSNSKITDITSVSKMDRYNEIRVEERTDVVDFSDGKPPRSSEESFAEKLRVARHSPVRHLSKTQYSPFQCNSNLKSTSAPPRQFSVIVEGEEGIRTNSELPPGSTKMSEVSFKTIKTTAQHHQMSAQPSAPSARHRHKYPDAISQKLASIDRKPRKRRTLEKIGASVMFNLFFNGLIEAGVVGILLFILDLIINSEQYDLHNYIFNY